MTNVFIKLAQRYITTGVSPVVTMDSFRTAIMDGNAYKLGFADPTGITAGTSYYYFVKNTSLTRSIWLRPLDFNEGTLLIRIVKGGTFALGGVTYNPNDYIDMPVTATLTSGTNTITGTFDTSKIKVGMTIVGPGIPTNTFIGAVAAGTLTLSANASLSGLKGLLVSAPSLVSRNLNSNYSGNVSDLKMWYQGTLGTITYTDSATDQVLHTIDYAMQAPSALDSPNEMNILKPGDEFMVILTNYGTAKIPYKLNCRWAEV